MSFNLDTFKEKLKSKGISIQAEADCVIAGLSWWVEGIEKAPKLGDLLFYVVNGTRYGVKPSKKAKHDIEWYYDQLKTGMKGAKGYSAGLTQFLNAWVKKGELAIVFKGKVKASEIGASAGSEKVENPETEISDFIDDVNGLTIGGKRVFNAEKKGDSIVIKLLIKKFETDDMDRLNEIVEDKLEILFPITQQWMDADKGQTFGDRKKVGDITMYVEGWSAYEFSDRLTIEDCSKIDWQNLPSELTAIYKVLKKDCSILENSVFKVTADVCEVTSGSKITKEMISKVKKCFKKFDTPYYNKLLNDLSVIEGTNDIEVSINISAEEGADLDKFSKAVDEISSTILEVFPKEEYHIKEEMDDSKDAFGMNITKKNRVPKVKETLSEVNKENFEGINQEHDRLMYMKVSPQDFISMWKTSTKFNPTQLNKIVFGFKLASRILGSKFEDSGIKIEYFFKRQDGKGYIRVEYKNELYIIYVSQSDENGDIKVVTRKMKKMIPVKNFNLLSTSVSSLAFENATLPPNFKKVWEEVSKD